MNRDANTKQLTVLIDVEELKEFQSACRTQDMNSSQAVRALFVITSKNMEKKRVKNE